MTPFYWKRASHSLTPFRGGEQVHRSIVDAIVVLVRRCVSFPSRALAIKGPWRKKPNLVDEGTCLTFKRLSAAARKSFPAVFYVGIIMREWLQPKKGQMPSIVCLSAMPGGSDPASPQSGRKVVSRSRRKYVAS